MAERVDVCIVGSGFGGSITAWRLAELYRAAGADPSPIVVLERGRRYGHTDFRQSMDIDHLSDVYLLIQRAAGSPSAGPRRPGRHRQRRRRRLEPVPGRVAARADARPSSAATTAPATAPTGACGRADLARARSTPTTRAPRPGCACGDRRGTRCRSPAACGRPRSHAAGHTCDRVPLAIIPARCVEREVVPHRLHLRREELADHQLPACGRGRSACGCGPTSRSSRSRSPRARPLPLRRERRRDGQRGRRTDARSRCPARRGRSSARCWSSPPARWATPPLLMRSRPQLPSLSSQVGHHLGCQRRPRRGARVRPDEGAQCARAARLRRVLQGQADHDDDLRLLGRAPRSQPTTARASRCRRSSCRR